jgi:hypothetical protein
MNQNDDFRAEPVGPSPETSDGSPVFQSPHDWYASQHGAWRKASKFCSSMTPSEVPDDWTLQDRIRAFLTLRAFARNQNPLSGSPEY